MTIPISSHTVLSSLSERTKRHLESITKSTKVPKGEQFLWEGDEVEKIYFIIRGYAKIYHFSDDGREQILAILDSGQWINTIPALRGEQGNHANGVAMTEMELGVMAARDFLDAIREFSDFALLILHDVADKLDHMTNLVAELSLYTTRQRLIHFLLEHCKDKNTIHGWTQEEIASQVGTVRDVVSRLLGLFARQGYIRVERQRIIVLDEASLRNALNE